MRYDTKTCLRCRTILIIRMARKMYFYSWDDPANLQTREVQKPRKSRDHCIALDLNTNMLRCLLYSSGSGQRPVVDLCEHGNEFMSSLQSGKYS
jgi:hypothetical protein